MRPEMLRSFINPLFGAWLLVILSLSPILRSGPYSDDLANLQVRKAENHHTISAAAAQIKKNIIFWHHAGRVTPLTYAFMEVYYWIPDSVLAFKFIILLVNLLAVFMFTLFLQHVGMSDWRPLALLTYAGFLQFYVLYHDAYTSLHAMYPTMMVLIMATLILMQKALIADRYKWFWWPAFFGLFAITLLYSELSTLLLPLCSILIVRSNRSMRQRLVLLTSLAGIGAAYMAATIWVRHHMTEWPYEGLEPTWFFPTIYDTFMNQFKAAIPMRALYERYDILCGGLKYCYAFAAVAAVILVPLAVSYWRGKVLPSAIPHRMYLALIGLTLWIYPALLIMVSKKYQRELHPGIGYLPVYIQVFGEVILFIVFLDVLMTMLRPYRIVIISFALTIILVTGILNFAQDNISIDQINQNRSVPAMIYYLGLKNGILAHCENNAVVVLHSDFMDDGKSDYQRIVTAFYRNNLKVIKENELHEGRPGTEAAYYMLGYDATHMVVRLEKMEDDGSLTEVKLMNYPEQGGFSFFDLISTPM